MLFYRSISILYFEHTKMEKGWKQNYHYIVSPQQWQRSYLILHSCIVSIQHNEYFCTLIIDVDIRTTQGRVILVQFPRWLLSATSGWYNTHVLDPCYLILPLTLLKNWFKWDPCYVKYKRNCRHNCNQADQLHRTKNVLPFYFLFTYFSSFNPQPPILVD